MLVHHSVHDTPQKDDATRSLELARTSATELYKGLETKGQVISQYLNVGKALHGLRQDCPSTKLFNARIKAVVPELLLLDASTRSDSLWLYNAVATNWDNLSATLGIEHLAETGRTHPSAIRRLYRDKLRAV
jgi:hypothetical protein